MAWDLLAFDILILALVGMAFYKGFKSGLVNQLVWLLSVVPAYLIGVWSCYSLYSLVGWELYSKHVSIAIWFVLVFSIVLTAMHYGGRALTNLLNFSIVGIANSILGGVLNLTILVVILIALLNLGSILAPAAIRELDDTVSVSVSLRVEQWLMDGRLLKLLESKLTRLIENS